MTTNKHDPLLNPTARKVAMTCWKPVLPPTKPDPEPAPTPPDTGREERVVALLVAITLLAIFAVAVLVVVRSC